MPRPEERVIHIHIHNENNEALVAAVHDLVAAVETSTADIITRIDELGEAMATDLSRITQEVEDTRTVIDSAITLLNGLAQALRDAAAGADVTVEVNALADALDQKQSDLAAAIEANTPADPNATP